MSETILKAFLDTDEIERLTGRKAKSFQIVQLKLMGIMPLINAKGEPIVPRSVIDGNGLRAQNDRPAWTPKPLR